MENEDLKHLDLLALFHYIVGGFTALFSCLPFLHVFMGLAIVSGKFIENSNGSAPPPFLGWIFVISGLLFVVLGWSLAVCMILVGKKLKQRKGRLFCMIVAGIECIIIPFGTVLGVFTIVVLNKDSVREMYTEQSNALD